MIRIAFCAVVAFSTLHVAAAEPDVKEQLLRAEPDEPFAQTFSAAAAARSLDASAADWRRVHNCVQCHAYLMYLPARTKLDRFVSTPPEARELHDRIATDPKHHQRVRYRQVKSLGPQPIGSDGVVTAFGLAMYDRATTGKLHPTTRAALDWMLSTQNDAGGWYVVTDSPPDLFGAFTQTMLAAIAIQSAPDGYADAGPAKSALDKIRDYVRSSPPQTPYQTGMLLWAASQVHRLADEATIAEAAAMLRALQHDDGGWSIVRFLADDERRRFGRFAADRPSDAFGTGFAVFALRNAGVPADDPQLTKAVGWLESNQRASGRWFLKSLVNRPANVVSNSATAWAVMALDACAALD